MVLKKHKATTERERERKEERKEERKKKKKQKKERETRHGHSVFREVSPSGASYGYMDTTLFRVADAYGKKQ